MNAVRKQERAKLKERNQRAGGKLKKTKILPEKWKINQQKRTQRQGKLDLYFHTFFSLCEDSLWRIYKSVIFIIVVCQDPPRHSRA